MTTRGIVPTERRCSSRHSCQLDIRQPELVVYRNRHSAYRKIEIVSESLELAAQIALTAGCPTATDAQWVRSPNLRSQQIPVAGHGLPHPPLVNRYPPAHSPHRWPIASIGSLAFHKLQCIPAFKARFLQSLCEPRFASAPE